MNKYIILSILILGITAKSWAQAVLSKSDAVSIALENNFDIRAAINDQEVAENNASILNSGYLPTVTGTAATNYSISNSNLTFSDGSDTTINGANSYGTNGQVRLDYTVFDGFGRMYNYKILQMNYDLSELQARLVMENTLINLFTGYYEIARLTENEQTQKETLDISRERLQRAKYSFDYGQNTNLDVLNAEVDYNTDSINYLTITQQLRNQKRTLNLMMGRDVRIEFEVDTTLTFDDILYSTIEEHAKVYNATVLQEKNRLTSSQYSIQVAKSSIIPKIGINGSYGHNYNHNAPGNFLSELNSTTGTVGASLSWNIFDGGKSNIQRQNSRLAYENQKISLERAELTLETQLQNAWTLYQTALFVMQAESKNLDTNQLNFNRSKEQYELGQITSIEFRQAQFNLLTASLNFNQAKYSAKNAELALLQLSGSLLNASF
ncbi:TolC family protein [Reichenbachiella agarivorans]|uniref:TolC family protein n=1 Tax=Reichenbachiella agarivorans TaxID=2979464 RepID=A0ABY6CRC4_9BACT|nr:TolC family protein [Reichenbachiella agarivorans]UXP31918.1 TolC family protein [Reichenbachiella agarivorans]